MTIRIVIADDHPVFRYGLRALLASRAGHRGRGRQQRTGTEAVSAGASSSSPTCCHGPADARVRRCRGEREIGRTAPHVAVLVLTMFDDDDSVFAAMRAGARGYLLKGASQDEIGRAIDAVAAGEAIFGPAVARRVLEQLGAPGVPATPFPGLTPRERQVLELVTEGLTTTAIGARLGLGAQDRHQPHVIDLHETAGSKPGRGRRPRSPSRARPVGSPEPRRPDRCGCRARADSRTSPIWPGGGPSAPCTPFPAALRAGHRWDEPVPHQPRPATGDRPAPQALAEVATIGILLERAVRNGEGFRRWLRPDQFPDRAASLLRGLLAATRTGLTPASDYELTTRDQLHRPPPVSWAHESHERQPPWI